MHFKTMHFKTVPLKTVPLKTVHAVARLLAPFCLLALAACGMPAKDIRAENRAISWSGKVSACDDPGVLTSLSGRIASTENAYWNTKLEILRFEHVRQTSMRKNGPQYIPRRGCAATAILANNTRRAVRYTLVSEAGTFGLGDQIEYCLAGHDHDHIAPPACTRQTR